MKTIFIMGILNFFCGISAAQPQYWVRVHTIWKMWCSE